MIEKSSSSLERDAERVRADIANTADHLKAKMSPGQLMDEVVDYFKDGDVNQMVANIKHQVRDNPLALALVGGGLAWLMMGSGTQHAGSGASGRPRGSASTAVAPVTTSFAANGGVSTNEGGSASLSPAPAERSTSGKKSLGVGSALGAGASSMKDSAGSAAGKVGDAASAGAAKVSDAVGSVADTASTAMHDMRDSASEHLADVSKAGAEMGERIKSTFLDALDREPLVVGALGVAVGAAIGAMMPVTPTERENLGEASMKMREEAESALSDGMEKAKGVASEVYATAREEADRQGLTAGGKPLAEKVADVSKAVGAKAKQAATRTMDDAERSVDRATDGLKPARQTR